MWYEKFSWPENVFSTRPNPDLIALEKEKKDVKDFAESERIILVKGEIGSGKTSLLLWLKNTLKKTKKTKKTPVILLDQEIETKEKFLSCLKRQRKLLDKILRRKYPKNLVVLLDEGEKFPEEVIETLRLMWDKREIFSVVITTTDASLQNFSLAFKDRIGKIIVLPTLTRGDLVEIIRKRVGSKNPFTPEAMIVIAENSASSRKLLENCAEICSYCAEKGIREITREIIDEYVTKTRQKIQIEEKIEVPVQRIELSPVQQRIAELLERGINTVGEIAKGLNMNDAAARTQIERMIKKGYAEVISEGRPKKYGLKKK